MPTPALRYFPRPAEPEPKPIGELTRPELAGRIHVLRQVHDLIRDQAAADGAVEFASRGSIKREMIALEMELFRRDHPETAKGMINLPLEVALAQIGRRA